MRNFINIIEEGQEEPIINAEVRGSIAWVHDLFVPKSMRNTGIGSRIYKDWEASLPASVKLVKLFAADYGDGLGNSDIFWGRFGFEHQYYGEDIPYESDHLMWKGVNGNPTPEPVYWDAYEDD